METVLSVVAWWVVSFALVALVPALRAARSAFMVWQAVTVGGLISATDAPTLDDIMAAMESDARRVEQPAPRAKRGGRPRLQREPLIISEGKLGTPYLAGVFVCYLGTGKARAVGQRVARLWRRGDYAGAEEALGRLWGMMEARAGQGVEFAAWGRNRATFGYRARA